MHGRLGIKDIFQQLARRARIEHRSCFYDIIQQNLALEYDQRPIARPGKPGARLHGLHDRGLKQLLVARAIDQLRERAAADLLQPLAQLRLEHNDQRKQPKLHRVCQQIVHDL